MNITAPLSINNGAATPVAKSFAPAGVSPALSKFVERSAPASAGFLSLTVGYSEANSRRPTHRIDIGFDLPVLSTVNGVSTVAHVGRFRGYFVVPDTMNASDRADLAAYVANAFDAAAVRAVVKDLDAMY